MSVFWRRVVRAVRLEAELYEEVEADRGALGQALAVVVLSSVAAGLGSTGALGLSGMLWATVSSLVGWYVWAWLAYVIGTRVLPEEDTRADHGELLRTVGFAMAPGMLRVVGLVPALGRIAFAVAAAWTLLAMVVAVRQALDYRSTARAAGVCLVTWVLQGILMGFFHSFFGSSGPTG